MYYICRMSGNQKISQGSRLNKLRRYQLIKQEFDKWDALGVPTTVIHKEHIYPKFFISRTTLYAVLTTSINKELAEIEVNEPIQVSLEL